MTGLRRWWPAAVAGALLWGIVGYFLTKPTDFHDYRRTVVQVADSAYVAVSTAQMTVRAQLDGKVTGRYTTAALQDATDAVAGAWKQFAAVAPVDDATTAMRDELGPVLLDAVRTLGDLVAAEDQGAAATAAALPALGPVADDLSDFLERHK
jgi:hypothetical protein